MSKPKPRTSGAVIASTVVGSVALLLAVFWAVSIQKAADQSIFRHTDPSYAGPILVGALGAVVLILTALHEVIASAVRRAR